MKVKFKNISEIRFGSTFKSSKNGSIPCLQVSSITLDGGIDKEQLVLVEHNGSIKENALYAGDIILPGKGQKFSSAIIPEKFDGRAVASTSLFVIKIVDKKILPEYIHWYLNLPRTKWRLESVATGTNIKSLSIKEIRNLSIEIPELETQRKVIELKKLQEEEFKKMHQLGDARKKLIEAVTKKLIE